MAVNTNEPALIDGDSFVIGVCFLTESCGHGSDLVALRNANFNYTLLWLGVAEALLLQWFPFVYYL